MVSVSFIDIFSFNFSKVSLILDIINAVINIFPILFSLLLLAASINCSNPLVQLPLIPKIIRTVIEEHIFSNILFF